MAQVLFTTKTLSATPTVPFDVKVGFEPGLIRVVNQGSMAAPANTDVLRFSWQYGMISGSADIETLNAGLIPVPTYTATNGITLLGYAPGAHAQYGAVVSAFTNANPGVITVDTTTGITAGCVIKVEGLADDQTGTGALNGSYTVASVTSTAITLTTTTVGKAVYISGGYVTLVTNANATSPNPPYNIYSNKPTSYNQAIQGFRVGTACLANATANDVLVIAVWDRNSGGL
jgi:hypothetical protein